MWAGEKEFMVDGFLANSALELCFQFVLHLSRQVSLYSFALGFHLWHFDSLREEFLDKVSAMNRTAHVDCQKTFPCVPDKFHVSDRRLRSQLHVDRGLGTTAG